MSCHLLLRTLHWLPVEAHIHYKALSHLVPTPGHGDISGQHQEAEDGCCQLDVNRGGGEGHPVLTDEAERIKVLAGGVETAG